LPTINQQIGDDLLFLHILKIGGKMSTIIQTEELTEVIDDIDDLRSLIVYNDDFNTFEHVIKTLIKVCGHEPHQAEQCTHIIHFSGKCSVKTGSFKQLKPMREGITDAGIRANIK